LRVVKKEGMVGWKEAEREERTDVELELSFVGGR